MVAMSYVEICQMLFLTFIRTIMDNIVLSIRAMFAFALFNSISFLLYSKRVERSVKIMKTHLKVIIPKN